MTDETTILAIDGDPSFLEATERILAAAGYQVITGRRAGEIVDLARLHHPALVLVGDVIPGGSGIDLIRTLKADPQLTATLEILVSSERPGSADFAKAVRDGLADGNIRRPVTESDPLARVDAFLRLRKTRGALHALLARYRLLFESFPLGITIADGSGGIVEANRVAQELLGIPMEEHVGRAIDGPEWRIVRTDGTPMPVEEYASVRALKEGRIVRDVEMGIVKSPEETTWISVTAAPLSPEGSGLVITYGDVTERVRAEEEARFHSEVLRNMAEGVYLIRVSDATIVFANPRFERMFGYEPGELVGRHVAVVNAPGDEDPGAVVREITGTLLRTGVWSGEVRNRRKDGSCFWCHANVSTFDSSTYGPVWVAVHEDVTARREAEGALQRSEAEIRGAQHRSRAAGGREDGRPRGANVLDRSQPAVAPARDQRSRGDARRGGGGPAERRGAPEAGEDSRGERHVGKADRRPPPPRGALDGDGAPEPHGPEPPCPPDLETAERAGRGAERRVGD